MECNNVLRLWQNQNMEIEYDNANAVRLLPAEANLFVFSRDNAYNYTTHGTNNNPPNYT